MSKLRTTSIPPNASTQSDNIKNIIRIITDKIGYIQEIIRNTMSSIKKNKKDGIFSENETTLSINVLCDLFEKTKTNYDKIKVCETQPEIDVHLTECQFIIDKLSTIICGFGTKNLDDLLFISFGTEFKNMQIQNPVIKSKYDLIKKYIQPTGYKVVHWKPNHKINNPPVHICENKITEEETNLSEAASFECFDVDNGTKVFYQRVYGIRTVIQNEKAKKSLIITGIIDDTQLDCITNEYIDARKEEMNTLSCGRRQIETHIINRLTETMTLKDVLINGDNDIIKKMFTILRDVTNVKQNKLDITMKSFLDLDIYSQRCLLLNLLVYDNDNEVNYISYLLYEMLSVNSTDADDNKQIQTFYESLPWKIKKSFKEVVKHAITTANNMMQQYDVSQISLEQQIYLMKADDAIKEKAMHKLKEIKGKPDEMVIKAKQYLEGLIKIPFGVYREEPALKEIKVLNEWYCRILNVVHKMFPEIKITTKKMYTVLDIVKGIKSIINYSNENIGPIIQKMMNTMCLKQINTVAQLVNSYTKLHAMDVKVTISNQTKPMLINKITECLENIKQKHPTVLYEIYDKVMADTTSSLSRIITDTEALNKNIKKVENTLAEILSVLDKSIYAHRRAKNQIMKIIGQWMNGEQSGYCFGFEGSPGIGKCFKKDTPIMLYNGKIKMVQDITVHDKLMGDDSKPRNVLALGRGREKMYRIEQVKGDDYTVNESHILSLKMTKPNTKGDKHKTIMGIRYYKNDTVDISIKDYLNLPEYLKGCLKGYKVGVDFKEREIDLDPYALGYWLGNGDKSSFRITTIEPEVVDYFSKYAERYGLQLTQGKIGTNNETTYNITTGKLGGDDYSKNHLLNLLEKYNLINNKHIPHEYKRNSKENRLKLLAGLIDSDGHYHQKTNCIEITQKNKVLADDILFLVRSVGIRGMIQECKKSCMYKGEKRGGTYHRITISGKGLDKIPVLLQRNIATRHKQIKNPMHTGITVVPLDEDEYYGFQIDGNSRFLLGDFTVAHNTSLAKKGLSKCLKNADGSPRPFSFIAVGGSCNGSTLEGHGYTYMNSTWGKIVDILMESKCMNPIIYVDELDKVSKSDSGREIIGIFTHLIDQTQNDTFQDKYFSGINIDLSKALFIFSYNDPDQIDRILLDRIHRIKFENLTLDDKMVIVKQYILPEINNKMGFDNIVYMSDEIIQHIIEKYTMEPGVRKLKELLFDLYGEINLDILKCTTDTEIELPIKITEEVLENKYLTKYHKIVEKTIHKQPEVGIINGLWANSLGMGGIIPIQTLLYPSSSFLELRLTGLQGDVMKESMNVAKSLAWNLTPNNVKTELLTQFNDTKCQGLHIHCPEGAVSKDGPSAGAAITTAIFSIFNNKKIKNNIAITGEINLQGEVTAIGGLDLKITGGIRAGIKTFIYPESNHRDFVEWKKNAKMHEGIEFIKVSNIHEVFKNVFA